MTQDREAQLAALLASDRLDSYALKHACLHGGLPEKLRPELWRHLLGVVDLVTSKSRHEREMSKSKKRKQYGDLVEELLQAAAKRPLPQAGARKPAQDTWLDDIDKDVRRTQTSYAFFSQRATASTSTAAGRSPAHRALFTRLDHLHPHRKQEIEERYSLSSSSSSSSSPKGKQREAADSDRDEHQSDRHFECLIRALYIFALLNPVHYVQGMSELIAPLYYVFSHSAESQYAEADAFWAFSTLMSDIGDFYLQDSDGSLQENQRNGFLTVDTGESRTGLGATLRRFARQLHWIDKDLAFDLHKRKEVQPTFYALRWITCLFALEFPIPDLVQIWDSLFALLADTSTATAKAEQDSQTRDFLLDIACAMILLKRGELLSSNFSTCLQILQNYVCDDVNVLMTLAFNIRERRITSSLTGLDFANYSSVPNSPALGNDYGEEDELTPLPNTAALQQSAKSMLTAAAGSSAAKALRNRFWRGSGTKEVDFPDDISDVSIVTAPAQLERSPLSPGLAQSPRMSLNLNSVFQTPSPTRSTPAASLPTSASSLFNRYASTLSQSDAAAALSKATTNSYIQALQWKEAAPSSFSQISSDLATRMSGAAGAAKTVIRPPSPHMDPPFTPPTASDGRFLSPEGPTGGSPGVTVLGERRPSTGPKPLLLSSSARRASGAGVPSHDVSPSGSRRSSLGGSVSGNVGLGLPSTLQAPAGEASPLHHRSRTPSPTASFKPLPHSRTASAVTFGSYKIGGGTRNGHTPSPSVGSTPDRSAHARGASLATPTGLTRSQPGQVMQGSLGPKDTAVGLDIPVSQLSVSSGPSSRRKHAYEDSPHSLLRSKGASSEMEVLNEALSPTEDGTSGPGTPSDILAGYFNSTGDSEVKTGKRTPPLPIDTRAMERYSLSDDIPLSPTSKLSRRAPRTSSLANDSMPPPTPSKDPGSTANDRGRRKLASSRRIARSGSIGAASVVSTDSRSSIDI